MSKVKLKSRENYALKILPTITLGEIYDVVKTSSFLINIIYIYNDFGKLEGFTEDIFEYVS